VSLEPVFYPEQTLHLIELTHEIVDQSRVGKLNHDPEIEAKIDWPNFRSNAEEMLQCHGKQKTQQANEMGYILDYQ